MAVLEKDTGITWVTRKTVNGFPTFTRANEAQPKSDQIPNITLNPGIESAIDHLIIKSQLPEYPGDSFRNLLKDRRVKPEDPQSR